MKQNRQQISVPEQIKLATRKAMDNLMMKIQSTRKGVICQRMMCQMIHLTRTLSLRTCYVVTNP
jgi:hypothetical protein